VLFKDIAAQKHVANYKYETTVGAGLPVLCNVRQLQISGDRIHRVRGTLSASVTWIMNRVNPSPLGGSATAQDAAATLPDAILDAHARGFTEVNFADDLCGHEMAVKLLILAREMGISVNIEDVEVTPIVPGLVREMANDEALALLRKQEAGFTERINAAARNGNVLRYVGKIEAGRCSISLEEVPAHHTFALLDCGGYAIEFHTECYKDHPLCVSGSLGDDAAVAAGLLADLVQVVVSLGAFDRGSVDLLGRLNQKFKRSPSFAMPMQSRPSFAA